MARVPVDPLRLDQQLCFALYAASRAVTRAYGPLLEPLGLTYPQYLVLLVLFEGEPRSVRELGEALGLDSGTLTPLLKRLEASGLVKRKRDAEDERVVRVSLTRKAMALHETLQDVPRQMVCKFGGDPERPGDLADIARLREALHALTRRLEPPPG
ncbi:MAG: MarR family transcriptional regulator [Polyangiaceae bacterium]|jgi:DNA-binding MarR family transcriptional regulator|nr:MarR family transcriptional regulator [Polyangiaceae bacterium]